MLSAAWSSPGMFFIDKKMTKKPKTKKNDNKKFSQIFVNLVNKFK